MVDMDYAYRAAAQNIGGNRAVVEVVAVVGSSVAVVVEVVHAAVAVT